MSTRDELVQEVAQLPEDQIRAVLDFTRFLRTGGSDAAWARFVAEQWLDELADPREDIYTLRDGEPVNAAG